MCGYTKNPFTFFSNHLKLEKAGQATASEIRGRWASHPALDSWNCKEPGCLVASAHTQVPPTETLRSDSKSLVNFPDELPEEKSVVNHSEASCHPLLPCHRPQYAQHSSYPRTYRRCHSECGRWTRSIGITGKLVINTHRSAPTPHPVNQNLLAHKIPRWLMCT